jgi:hypothetical protein
MRSALRKTQSSIVARRFSGETLHGVPFNQVYYDIECIDVKVEAVTLPDRFAPDDTKFWTSALTVHAAGMITAFRLKTGDSPADLPLRFSVTPFTHAGYEVLLQVVLQPE